MSFTSSIEQLAGLKRKISVTISGEKVGSVYERNIQKLIKTVKLPGFRPGKVPRRVVEERFANSLKGDVVRELLDEFLFAAIAENKLDITHQPDVDIPDLDRFRPNAPLAFIINVEVFPDVEIADFSGVKLERLVPKIQETDIDEVINNIRKQRAEKTEVERAAANGDYVKIDFEGFIDGEPFEGGSAKDFELALGAGRMIEGFESGLVGASAGEEREVTCRFPQDYAKESLAGKEANFKVTVKAVLEPILPELNDEFAKELGIEDGYTALRDKVRENLQKNADDRVQEKLRSAMIEKIAEMHSFELPERMLAEQLESFKKQNVEDAEKQARKSLTAGVLLRKVIADNAIELDRQRVREHIEEMAMNHPYPQQMLKWFYENKERMHQIENLVLEHQAIEKLIEQTQVEDKVIDYSQMNEG